MSDDERAIRELVRAWMEASKAGDVDSVLGLMSEDAVFQVVGQKPFGKAEFEQRMRAGAAGAKALQIDAANEIVEIKILGDWAYMRNYLKLTVAPKGGPAVPRSGYTLTILRKEPNGKWALTRDANLMTLDAS